MPSVICTFASSVSLKEISRLGAPRRLLRTRLGRFRASMSLSVGPPEDALFMIRSPTALFFFPGAQTLGMGGEAMEVPAAAILFRKANDILGFYLLDFCINGPKEKLDSTVINQRAIYVTSLAAVEVLRAREGGLDIIHSIDVTWLSLGEHTALAFAGAFSFEDGLRLVKLRGEAMQDAADAAKSAMVGVIGLDSEKSNYLVSGGMKGIEEVEAKAKTFKARMIEPLAVAGAFHTSFMDPAVSRLEAALATTEIRAPRMPFISGLIRKRIEEKLSIGTWKGINA